VIDTALLLAAGLGTRLAPLSQLRAKAALPIAGEMLIRRQIRWLAAAGVTRVVVNLHHRPASITGGVGHGDDLGVSVSYSWESTVLGSAGGPRRALDLIDRDRFLIVNGDTLTDLDLAALIAAHDTARPLVTLAASPAVPAGYNALLVDGERRWIGVRPAGSTVPVDGAPVHFVGVQLAERRAFAEAPADVPSQSIPWLYPRLRDRDAGSIRVWTSAATFHDVQTPADYLDTARFVAAREGRPLDVGRHVSIGRSARLEDTICWDDVAIGAGAHLVRCIAGDGVRVPDGLELRDACLVPASTQPPRAGDRVIGELLVAPFAAGRTG
jgi:NDP-sugar pyrophosphorylase family protein